MVNMPSIDWEDLIRQVAIDDEEEADEGCCSVCGYPLRNLLFCPLCEGGKRLSSVVRVLIKNLQEADNYSASEDLRDLREGLLKILDFYRGEVVTVRKQRDEARRLVLSYGDCNNAKIKNWARQLDKPEIDDHPTIPHHSPLTHALNSVALTIDAKATHARILADLFGEEDSSKEAVYNLSEDLCAIRDALQRIKIRAEEDSNAADLVSTERDIARSIAVQLHDMLLGISDCANIETKTIDEWRRTDNKLPKPKEFFDSFFRTVPKERICIICSSTYIGTKSVCANPDCRVIFKQKSSLLKFVKIFPKMVK